MYDKSRFSVNQDLVMNKMDNNENQGKRKHIAFLSARRKWRIFFKFITKSSSNLFELAVVVLGEDENLVKIESEWMANGVISEELSLDFVIFKLTREVLEKLWVMMTDWMIFSGHCEQS